MPTASPERKGQPSYVEAYKTVDGQKKLLGYVMLSTDITDIPAYSGKPVVTLIGMDTSGHFAGVKVLKHSEPILLLGIPEEALIEFNNQYLGKFVGDNIEIGRSRPEENIIGLDAITGATVTVIAQNQVMMLSGGEIAKQVGILKPTIRPQAKFIDTKSAPNWQQLVEEGSVKRLIVSAEEVGLPHRDKPYIDMWFGYLNQPTVGRAILGDGPYNSLMSRLKEGDHALFMIRTDGVESFKARASSAEASTTACRCARARRLHLPRHRLLQPLRHRRAGCAGLQRIGDLHRSLEGILGGLSVEAGVPRQQDGQGHRGQDLCQLRHRILAAGRLHGRRASDRRQARPGVAQDLEGPHRLHRRLHRLAGRHRSGLCQPRHAGEALDAQEQMAGECVPSTLAGW